MKKNFAIRIENNASKILDYLVSLRYDKNGLNGTIDEGYYYVENNNIIHFTYNLPRHLNIYSLDWFKAIFPQNSITGYKIKHEKYRQAIIKVTGYATFGETELGGFVSILRNLDVLDIWCTPIYENECSQKIKALEEEIQKLKEQCGGTKFNFH